MTLKQECESAFTPFPSPLCGSPGAARVLHLVHLSLNRKFSIVGQDRDMAMQTTIWTQEIRNSFFFYLFIYLTVGVPWFFPNNSLTYKEECIYFYSTRGIVLRSVSIITKQNGQRCHKSFVPPICIYQALSMQAAMSLSKSVPSSTKRGKGTM